MTASDRAQETMEVERKRSTIPVPASQPFGSSETREGDVY